MTRISSSLIRLALSTVFLTTWSSTAHAQAGQITFSAPMIGYAPSIGPAYSHSFLFSGTVRGNVTEGFGIWGTLGYGIGAGNPIHTPHQTGNLSAGLSASFDLLRLVPWLGLGFRASLLGTPTVLAVIPAVEVRLGIDVPFNRVLGMTYHLVYAVPFANRQLIEHMFEVSFGLRFALDL